MVAAKRFFVGASESPTPLRQPSPQFPQLRNDSSSYSMQKPHDVKETVNIFSSPMPMKDSTIF